MQNFGHLPVHGKYIIIANYNSKVILTDSHRIVRLLIQVSKNHIIHI